LTSEVAATDVSERTRRSGSRSGRIIAMAATAATLVLAAPGPSASAAETAKLVTIAARSCPSYDVIRGNRARNNIMESLKDLGPDTNYQSGEAITAEKEDADPQDACSPITGWRFTLGKGYQTRAVVGPWGALSKVTSPFSTPIATEDSVPQLNQFGQETGKSIAGAVTITLTDEQAQLAATSSSLWIQGGTPTDPVLNVPFPNTYGFGALRCAIDNLNGDNVEWIAYPTGARHVFCYAYYVKPPPTSGTIIVRKEVNAPSTQPGETFRFVGNISFNTDASFTLSAAPGKPGSMSFYRAGGASWDFAEQVPPGWQLTAITCTSATGASTSTTDLPTAKTTVALASGDTVTCTYSDRLAPPTAGLLLRKITRGGLGTFDFSVNPVGGGPTLSASATTTATGIAAVAAPVFDALAPGAYDVDEDAPSTDAGSWALERVTCASQARRRSTSQRVTLAAGTGTICTYENRFTPNGAIRLRKVTRGGMGTTGFVIDTVDVAPPRRYQQAATTTSEDDPALAVGSDTSRLPLGTYVITETGPHSTPTEAWRLDTVTCNGVAVPAEAGSLRVVLTEERPDLDCTFSNVLDHAAVLPATARGGDVESTPIADLAVTKRAARHTIALGETVRYTVHVTNRGPATAHNVVLAEQLGDRQAIIAASPARYHCSTRRKLPSCLIGTLRPGQTATIGVLARPRTAGLLPNRAVAVSATAEATLRNNLSRAAVLVRPPPHFTG
jgi:uncharacterized repeat protein (TIGR01451 family)